MSKKINKIKPVEKSQNQSVLINDMTFVSPDRNRKDIATLKSALLRAESITVPNRVRLYDLYHDIISLDGHLSGIVDKRIKTVTNKPIYFQDASGSRVEALDNLLISDRFKDLKTLVIESLLWGTSGVQFLRGAEFDFVEIPRKHIRPEQAVITRSQYDISGIMYIDMPDVWVLGKPYDLGLLLRCSMYALYKRSGLGDLAQYVEIFGQPVRIIYYDTYDTRTRDELRKMAETAGSSLVMMIPKQAQFEMLDGKTSNGNGDLQLGFLQFCNTEMSVAVLGNSETTASSSSSGYAQSQTHAEQQLEITRDDIDFLLSTLNSKRFLDVLRSYGYPIEGGRFHLEKEFDLEQLSKRLTIDKEVANRVPISDDYWYDTYGISKPDNYEELKTAQEQQRQATLDAMKSNNNNTKIMSNEKGTKNEEEALNKNKSEKSAGKKTTLADLFDFFDVAP